MIIIYNYYNRTYCGIIDVLNAYFSEAPFTTNYDIIDFLYGVHRGWNNNPGSSTNYVASCETLQLLYWAKLRIADVAALELPVGIK